MVILTFLGTADSVPSATRNHTAILLTHEGENILVDCGEGTQRQFRHAKLNPCKLTKILLTHWHADHVLGLPGLLKTLVMSGYTKTLHIFCPKGTKKKLLAMINLFHCEDDLSFEIKEVSGVFFEDQSLLLSAEAMEHTVPCNAYSFVLKGQRKIDRAKLKTMKLSSSPELKHLKEGKNIVLNGKKISYKTLTYTEDDTKITFILDTAMHDGAVTFAKDSDVLISEATFDSTLQQHATLHKHLTSVDAATLAKKSRSKKLYLTHISQRYDKKRSTILDEAKKIFPKTFLVKDLDVVHLKK